jgi:hypothetical protein
VRYRYELATASNHVVWGCIAKWFLEQGSGNNLSAVCHTYTPLVTLPWSHRSLSLESPLTGATRLARLSSLSSLTQVTQLVTGRLDEEAYPGGAGVGRHCLDSFKSSVRWHTPPAVEYVKYVVFFLFLWLSFPTT